MIMVQDYFGISFSIHADPNNFEGLQKPHPFFKFMSSLATINPSEYLRSLHIHQHIRVNSFIPLNEHSLREIMKVLC